MKNFFTIIFIFFFIAACGYKPILVKNNNFSFNLLKASGDKQVSEKLEKSLKKLQDRNSNINIEIINNYKKSVISKNEKGDPEIFLISIETELIITEGNDFKNKKIFNESLTYNNRSDKFKLKQYEKKLKSNLIDNVSYDIIIFLNSV